MLADVNNLMPFWRAENTSTARKTLSKIIYVMRNLIQFTEKTNINEKLHDDDANGHFYKLLGDERIINKVIKRVSFNFLQ